MDYVQRGILEKIELIEASNINGKYTTLSGMYRVLIEYQMYLLFACEWSRTSHYLSREKKYLILNELKKPVIGKLLGAILSCDEVDRDSMLQSCKKNYQKYINEFIEQRNRTFAHGTVIPNIQENIWQEVYVCYKAVYDKIQKLNIPVLSGDGVFYYRDSNDFSGIVTFDTHKFRFITLDTETISDLGLDEGRLSFLVGTEVFRVAPFLMVKRESNFDFSFYDYSSFNTANNKFEYCKVSDFDDEPRWSQIVPGYFQSFQKENAYTFCKANGMICNKFENNYDSFIAIDPITKYVSQVWKFIESSRSNVCITVRGGGGVGKTALVQYICTKYLFEPFNLKTNFEYVVFCSAKDRELKQSMNIAGSIQDIRINDVVQSYEDIVRLIGNVLGVDILESDDEWVLKIEKDIIDQSGLLLIIDDFETLEDIEKKKVVSLISRLSIDKHKVVITTRSQYMIGEEYYINELSQKQVLDFMRANFVNKHIKDDDRYLLESFERFITTEENKDYIYKMSQGLPLLALQLSKVLIISGFQREMMPGKWNEDVQEFLLGRLYSYFNTKTSKLLFVALAQYYKCGLTDIAKSELSLIYKLYCMYFKLDYVDYDQDLYELEKLKIIYNTPEYLKVSNVISGNLLERCKTSIIAEDSIDRLVFDDRLVKLCAMQGVEKAAVEYLQFKDRYMGFEYVELFALQNCLNYLNPVRFDLIRSYVEYHVDFGENDKLEMIFNKCKSFFVMEDDFYEFYSNLCLEYSYIIPELEDWMSHRQKNVSPEYLISKLKSELDDIYEDIQVFIGLRRKSNVPHQYKVTRRQEITGKIGTLCNYTIKELCNYNLDPYVDLFVEIKSTMEEISVVPEFNMMDYDACKKLLDKV